MFVIAALVSALLSAAALAATVFASYMTYVSVDDRDWVSVSFSATLLALTLAVDLMVCLLIIGTANGSIPLHTAGI